MAISCTPADLADAAACYCFDQVTKEKVKIYLLAVTAGLDNLTPSELAALAACYEYDALTMKKVQDYLLCQIANLSDGGTGTCENIEGAGDPT